MKFAIAVFRDAIKQCLWVRAEKGMPVTAQRENTGGLLKVSGQ